MKFLCIDIGIRYPPGSKPSPWLLRRRFETRLLDHLCVQIQLDQLVGDWHLDYRLDLFLHGVVIVVLLLFGCLLSLPAGAECFRVEMLDLPMRDPSKW